MGGVPALLPQVSPSLTHPGGWAKAFGPKQGRAGETAQNLQEGPWASGCGLQLKRTAATFEAPVPRGHRATWTQHPTCQGTFPSRTMQQPPGVSQPTPFSPPVPSPSAVTSLNADLSGHLCLSDPTTQDDGLAVPAHPSPPDVAGGTPPLSLGLPALHPTPVPAPGPSTPTARRLALGPVVTSPCPVGPGPAVHADPPAWLLCFL